MAGEPQTTARITVVVVSHNAGDYLRGCLASLAAQTFRDFETILVDNNSTDGSLALLDEAGFVAPPGFRVMRQSDNLGFAAANNIAAREGRGEWLALLNPDAEAEPDWLDKLLEAVAARPGYRMAASLQIALHDPSRLDGAGDCYLAWGYAWRGGFGHSVGATPPAGECFAPCGAAALYPRAAFLEAGGFDENYFCYHEDVDIAFRLRLLGERCQFVPEARVRHAGSALTGRGSAFSVFHGVRNGVWTWVKNMPGPLLVLGAPMWMIGTLALLARSVVRRQFAPTTRGLARAFGGLGPVLRRRRDVQAKRTAAPAAIAAALTWNPLSYVGRQIDVRPFAGRPTNRMFADD